VKTTRALCAAITCFVALTSPALAEVVYTPVNMRINVYGGQYNLDFNHDGVTDLVLGSQILDVYCQHGDGKYWKVTVTPAADGGVAGLPIVLGQFASALPQGVPVSSTQLFYRDYALLSEFDWGNCGSGSYGMWLNHPDRYLGLQFQILNHGLPELHYGWVKLTEVGYLDQYDQLQAAIFLQGFAYETVAGQAILTGATSGPIGPGHALRH